MHLPSNRACEPLHRAPRASPPVAWDKQLKASVSAGRPRTLKQQIEQKVATTQNWNCCHMTGWRQDLTSLRCQRLHLLSVGFHFECCPECQPPSKHTSTTLLWSSRKTSAVGKQLFTDGLILYDLCSCVEEECCHQVGATPLIHLTLAVIRLLRSLVFWLKLGLNLAFFHLSTAASQQHGFGFELFCSPVGPLQVPPPLLHSPRSGMGGLQNRYYCFMDAEIPLCSVHPTLLKTSGSHFQKPWWHKCDRLFDSPKPTSSNT